MPWSIGSVGGRDGGKRKVLKLLCQIERERERGREGLTEGGSTCVAFVAAARPLLLIENETNSKTQWKWGKGKNTSNNMKILLDSCSCIW